ncbi:secreted RxLR effector protein 78-like [Aristolochia californica]|uniref:secreted RxLR effector protein 78-like n=1 Tax=Aristolochia californica TaxID=171875 RepID=UPI0035DEEE17
MACHELIHHFKALKLPRFILKLDFEKAFDKVNWKLLDTLLGKMGFRAKWRFWIQSCISSTSYSVLLNGMVCGYFKGSKGIRQGDLLSPLLFNVVAEYLSTLIYSAKNLGWLLPTTDCATFDVSILQFANDTICFGVGTMDQI